MLLSQNETITATKQAQINQSLFYYSEAKRLAGDQSSKINYSLGMAQLYINNQQYNEAIQVLEEIIQLNPSNPDLWKYEQSLAQLYLQVGNQISALTYAQKALEHAPEDQQEFLQNFISQFQYNP
jgi:tetratricopeptide (TPR) repeat protein